MALTNYLTQSVALSFLFYGYGLGLYGRVGSAAAAGCGLSLYAAPVVFSWAWLKWSRFGPVEWIWRSARTVTPSRCCGQQPEPYEPRCVPLPDFDAV